MSTHTPPSANAVAASYVYVSNLDGEIIEVQAGQEIFQIHEDVLRQCPFSVNALNREWVSACNSKPIDLIEGAIVFVAYQQYLYNQIHTTFNARK